MRILIGAYACEPGVGSEPGVGWNWSVQAARHGHEVHVLTRENNREKIEMALRSEPIPNLTFHYLDLSATFMALKKRGGYYGLLAYYYVWQFALRRTACRLHATLRFDLAHHITFVIDWMPSGLAALRIPLIWGPIGGSTHVIPHSFRIPYRRARVYEVLRRTLQTLLKSLDPLVHLTRARAQVILVYTEEALSGLPPEHRRKARPIIHIGVAESEVPNPSRPPDGPFTILTGGRLVHWKGFDLLLEGFARFLRETGADAKVKITGGGPFRSQLIRITQEHHIEAEVEFLGWLPRRDEVFVALRDSHLFALPTLRDGPPVSILEAMLAARPILCLDLGATRELVPESAGIKIPVRSREQVIRDLAEALAWAYDNRDRLAEMGSVARNEALTRHAWKRIGDEVELIYRRVLEKAKS